MNDCHMLLALASTVFLGSEPQVSKYPVHTSPKTRYVSATKPNRLMLFMETNDVYCENHTEHTDTLCGHNAQVV
jgi:hypothetical protein